MTTINSVAQIDLSPKPGFTYFNCQREWREEFIYFVMVDRFHDDTQRSAPNSPGRSAGIRTPDDFYGGKLKGITANLDYIAGLGCTTIWLSPIFENNPGAYHGYNTSSYLDIDPHFGTKQDLIDLVQAAHRHDPPLRVLLDVVINHSGDNWAYPGDYDYYYSQGQQFDFGHWRRADRPVPVELRNESLYHRCGRITDYKDSRQVQLGDISSLKDYANDDTALGSDLINLLIKAHCYWIREADIDGFRVDAVKHLGPVACSRFASMIREYAYSLGKRRFFLFGELADSDDGLYDRYIGPNTSQQDGNNTVFFGIDSLLDFRLADGIYQQGIPQLRAILRGQAGPESLFARLESQRLRAVNRGELGRYLVTFIDNHDSFWQGARLGHQSNDRQIIGAIGFLLCALGTACLYYGTEQGFAGHGGDNDIRESMFDRNNPGFNLLNTNCNIYQAISAIAQVSRATAALRFGRMYYRQISSNLVDFGFPYGSHYTLAFSRMLYGHEVLVAYNVSDQPRTDAVIVDASLHQSGEQFAFLYPTGRNPITVEQAPSGARYITLPLSPHEFAILE